MSATVDEAHGARRAIDDLDSARPLLGLLPSIFHDDDVAGRWLSGLDRVVAPVLNSVDCFSAYLDAQLAPPDFVRWLGSWVGADLDADADVATQRRLVASYVAIHAQRGTAAGITSLLELSLPVRCEVIEGGAAVASSVPDAPLPGTAAGAFIVRLTPTAGPLDDARRRRAILLVESMRPAHLPAVVEFTDAPDQSTSSTTHTSSTSSTNDAST